VAKHNQHEASGQVQIRINTPEQQALVDSLRNNDLTVVCGPAGTGKTFLSLAVALELLNEKRIDKILVVRRITPTFGEDLGALPGDLLEKFLPYAGAVFDNLTQLISRTLLMQLLAEGKLEFIPVSWCRGRTFVRTFVLVDEIQQMNPEMLLCVLTRLGRGSKMALAGDPQQADHGPLSGIEFSKYIATGLKNAAFIQLSNHHVERHPLVRLILQRSQSWITPFNTP
jgi:phosphate starvation-inducible PhoH-like protein